MTGPQAKRQQAYNRSAYDKFLILVQAECSSCTESQILALLEDCPLLDNDELCEETAAEEAVSILRDPAYRLMIEQARG